MERLVIVARLQDGTYDEAEDLLAAGPPFDPAEHGFRRHTVYLTATEVVFFFEADEVEWIVSDLLDDPVLAAALAPWRSIVDGPPRIAHERYDWSRAGGPAG